jgi:leucyl aminopeptidase
MVKSYAQKFDPAVVIDVATLTGAVIMALGKHHSGVMANDQSLAAYFISSIPAPGFKEIPPLSKVTPLPTKTIGLALPLP